MPPSTPPPRSSAAGASRRRAAFWLGVVLVGVGVSLHLPMYIDAREMDYRLAGMPVDTPMLVGSVLLVLGVAAAAWGLLSGVGKRDVEDAARVRVSVDDDVPVRKAHVVLLLVMAAAVTIDVMKPVTLGFVLPGVAKEYDLLSPVNPGGGLPAALLPLSGITGTVIGSLIWGWLGDRAGRRNSILFAGILFVATAVCGTMPEFGWNLAMCFLMGLGVGGMLPIAFALLAETIPSRHRGWLLVLIGGDVAGAYFLTSWLAGALTPEFGWRILWLLGLPTGLLLIGLARWIPESARYLLATGRTEEAHAVAARYGGRLVPNELVEPPAGVDRWSGLLRGRLGGISAVTGLIGLGVGVVTFGFQLWIPSNLQKLGFSEVTSDEILRDSALMGLPATVVVAALYGLWSARKTMALLGLLTAAALVGFVVAGDGVADNRTLLYALLVLPLTGMSSLLAALLAYASEVYPTTVRSRGTGLAAGASKLGGVFIIGCAVLSIAPLSIAGTALIGAIPLVLGAAAILVFGVETRRRSLEAIEVEELQPPPVLAVTR